MFLDRDGVLNDIVFRHGGPGSPRSLTELRIAPDAAAVLARLRQAGFILVCVTNQPDVARGDLPERELQAIHAELRRELPLDDLLACCHDDADECDCRKPKAGMLLAAASRHDIDLGASFMVGDRWRDVGAGAAAGCRTILIVTDCDDRAPNVPPDATVRSLSEAAAWILTRAGKRAC